MRLPVVMYHQVAEPPATVRHPSNFVRPTAFADQLAALDRAGYEPVSLEQWVAYRAGQATLPRRPVVLTFDDGYATFADVAWPILARHGWTGTVFLVAAQLGGTNGWDRDELPMPLLDAATMRDLLAAGAHVGAHSLTHQPLGKLPLEAARVELEQSRRVLEAALGRPITTMAWPYNNQTASVRRLARAAGYHAAVRGRGRVNTRWTNPLALYRVKADLETTPASLCEALTRHHFIPW